MRRFLFWKHWKLTLTIASGHEQWPKCLNILVILSTSANGYVLQEDMSPTKPYGKGMNYYHGSLFLEM